MTTKAVKPKTGSSSVVYYMLLYLQALEISLYTVCLVEGQVQLHICYQFRGLRYSVASLEKAMVTALTPWKSTHGTNKIAFSPQEPKWIHMAQPIKKTPIWCQRKKLFSIYRTSKFYSGKAAVDSKMTTFIIKKFLTFEKCIFTAKCRNCTQI